jgi:hypothetical protein
VLPESITAAVEADSPIVFSRHQQLEFLSVSDNNIELNLHKYEFPFRTFNIPDNFMILFTAKNNL